MSDWQPVRTCSRVSSGPCIDCQKQTYHRAWRNDRQVLCRDCYERRFEPDKAREREEETRKRKEEKRKRLELALAGGLPGAEVTKSGAVLGPPVKVFGITTREILRDPTYDTAAFEGESPPESIEVFRKFRPFPKGNE